VVAAVFAANGRYGSTETFLNGFTPALWVAASLSLVGVVAALLSPAKTSIPRTASLPEETAALNAAQ
jgi:hypothetical protein